MSFPELIGLLIALLAFFILGSGRGRVVTGPEAVVPPPPLPKKKNRIEPLPPPKKERPQTNAYTIRKTRPSSSKKSLRSSKSLKTFVVMKEILGKPKGL